MYVCARCGVCENEREKKAREDARPSKTSPADDLEPERWFYVVHRRSLKVSGFMDVIIISIDYCDIVADIPQLLKKNMTIVQKI